MTDISPNAEQVKILEALTDFVTKKVVLDTFAVLSGAAGTGKSYLSAELRKILAAKDINVVTTATTNKAVRVLRRGGVSSAITIYSLLGLRMTADGEIKKLSQPKEAADLSEYKVVLLDEAGFCGEMLFTLLKKASMETGTRFICVGDKYQLPPVGEATSPVWKLPQKWELEKVMRHDNQILRTVTGIRKALQSGVYGVDLRSDNDGSEGVWKLSKDTFLARVLEDVRNGKFSDVDNTKVIAWRNATVDRYNFEIRKVLFGEKPDLFEIGEKLVAVEPCYSFDDSLLLSTDEEATVVGISTSRHSTHPEFRAIDLTVRNSEGVNMVLTILHPESFQDYQSKLNAKRVLARSNGQFWPEYWALDAIFHKVRYAYALTTHRVQGSTLNVAYVDFGDILANRNREEALKCLYTASSRPKFQLILA